MVLFRRNPDGSRDEGGPDATLILVVSYHISFEVEMAERSNATVCKTVARKGYLGSNPSLGTKALYYSSNLSLFVLD